MRLEGILRLLGRAGELAIRLLLLSVVLFGLLHLAPGTPEAQLVDPSRSAADVARLTRLRGLDRPIAERYLCWLTGRAEARCAYWPSRDGVLGGDLGWSRVYKLPVADLLGPRLLNTLGITVPAFLLALLIAIPLGIAAALREGGGLDRCVSAACSLGVALPVHWIGMLAILVFAVRLGWLPAGGVDDPRTPSLSGRLGHAVLPIAILTLLFAARWTRHTRAALLETLPLEHVTAARAKGLGEVRVILHHALRPSLIPIVTVVAQSIPALFSGALVVERVFGYPGMGSLIWESLVAGDDGVAMIACLIFALLTMAVTWLLDAAYVAIDPRTRRPA